MSDYKSGYDPKYGYNKNAFAHKTMGTAVMGQVVKLIATPIGLVSEAIHSRKSKAQNASRKEDSAASLNSTISEGTGGNNTSITSESQANADNVAYVHVAHEEAHELIASGQAEPTDGQSPTHELVAESDGRYDHEVVEYDEADWALDETVDETEREDSTATRPDMPIPVHGAVSTKDRVRKLPFPVILPQRRPGTKTRGFVRAYPPVLGEMSISQDAFIWFLKEFHKSAQASPIFDVIIVATAIAAAYPDPLVGLGIQAVQIAAAIGQEIQERLRTNNFLIRANKDIFIPKGMYAMIVTYKKGVTDQTTISSQPVDLGATAIAKYDSELLLQRSSPSGTDQADGIHKVDQMKEKMNKLRIASGETHGEAEMPIICAPLIFPGLDAAAKADAETENEGSDRGIGSGIKTKSKDAQKFINDYFDRRAQASYVRACLHLVPFPFMWFLVPFCPCP